MRQATAKAVHSRHNRPVFEEFVIVVILHIVIILIL
jgi:hypothetical protein